LLKLTAPGLPDIYQGNELWDFSLVDPDNRRPVDYAHRAALLKEIKAATKRKGKNQVDFVQELAEQWYDGRIKLFVTQRTLHFRRTHYDLFAGSAYTPLATTGERAQYLCAYLRHNAQGQQAIIVVPRLVATLTDRAERPPVGSEIWGDTSVELPDQDGEHSYSNLFTSKRSYAVDRGGKLTLPVAEILGDFPVALLTRGA
jgi:(1->4)-alpha-D-glucan 1-alpha-D-glucosylmutase